jgi:hypothetical protein
MSSKTQFSIEIKSYWFQHLGHKTKVSSQHRTFVQREPVCQIKWRPIATESLTIK